MPDSHSASCRCGQLTATATGTPIRISVCHCLNCQKRSGSAFAAQVRFPAGQVTTSGEARNYTTSGENGAAHFHFCPECGSTVFFTNDAVPDTIAIALGAFDDPHAFTPTVTVFGNRKHDWVEVTGAIEQFD